MNDANRLCVITILPDRDGGYIVDRSIAHRVMEKLASLGYWACMSEIDEQLSQNAEKTRAGTTDAVTIDA